VAIRIRNQVLGESIKPHFITVAKRVSQRSFLGFVLSLIFIQGAYSQQLLRLGFLGLAEGAYPEFGASFNGWVESELSGDSVWSPEGGLALRRHIADSLGAPTQWNFDRERPMALQRNLDYLADVEPLPSVFETQRTWWKPWTVQYREAWSMRLRVYDARARRMVREDTVWAIDSGKVFRLTPLHQTVPDGALGEHEIRQPWYRRLSAEAARLLVAAADSLKTPTP
jgi:hypothetical protein